MASLTRPRLSAALLALTLIGSAAVLTAGPAAGVGTAPPWAPNGVSQDPHAISGLHFYNAAGTAITSGSTSTAPFAAYVQGAVAPRTVVTDTKASLFAYVPQVGQTPDVWSTQEGIGLATDYPNSAAPAGLATSKLPLNTGTSGDLTLDNVASDLPNTSTTAGYVKTYEIRLYTSSKGNGLSVTYDYADITVDTAAHTWTQIFTPTPVTKPGAPSSVTAVAGNGTAKVSWKAPTTTGGAAVTGYDVEYSSNNGSTWKSGSAAFHTNTALTETLTGLTNGTTYLVRVAAINSAGTGTYSSTASVKPVADASALTVGGTLALKYGASSTLSTKLTDKVTGKVIASATVLLRGRTSSTAAFATVATVKTSTTGAASATVKPTRAMQYQWSYAGATGHAATVSGVQSVTVAQVVSIASTNTKPKKKASFKIYGTVTPTETGQSVTLQDIVKGKWVTVGKSVKIATQTLPNGKKASGYIFTLSEATAATYTFRVYRPATGTLAAGYSASLSIKVS